MRVFFPRSVSLHEALGGRLPVLHRLLCAGLRGAGKLVCLRLGGNKSCQSVFGFGWAFRFACFCLLLRLGCFGAKQAFLGTRRMGVLEPDAKMHGLVIRLPFFWVLLLVRFSGTSRGHQPF